MLTRSFLLTSLLMLGLASLAQDFSNKGKEFWLSYSYHVGMVNSAGGGPPVMTLYITSDVTTKYQVEIFGGALVQSGTITAGQVVTAVIPPSAFINNEGLFTNKAIRVTADLPVVVYSYITRNAASSATLCLPTTVLGREYYSANFTQISNETNSNSYFTIIAVEDNTSVEITPTQNTKNGWQAGQTYTVSLNKGEIYQVLGALTNTTNGLYNGLDLTGSKIKSVATATGGCKRIAVFSGSGKITISATPCGASSADNLYQQLYPVVSWGLKYLTVPSYGRATNIYRILRSDPSANVTVNGAAIPAAAWTGNYYQFYNSRANAILSDKPISVAQYFTTQGCDGNPSPYDPNMIMLNPVEQNIDKVTLVNSNLVALATANAPHQHHIQVIMRNGGTGISSFKFDGNTVAPANWSVHPSDPAYSYLYLPLVTQGYHRIESDSGFNAVAYGYANAESYGYSAGANVKDLYQFVSIKNEYATVDYPSTCTNSPFFFKMTFPYQPNQIKWQFGAALNAQGIADVTINAPAYDSTWVVNGKQLYRYSLPSSYQLSAQGNYLIKVIALNATAEGCTGEQEIDYTLQVFTRPVADFNFTSTGCVPDDVKFNDASNAGGRPAYKWNWNVSDGRSSDQQNPSFQFTSAGNFDVSLSVITDIGCVSSPATKTVSISAVPTAQFNISVPACVGQNINFSDGSTPGTGNIVQWNWNFGDGNTVTRTTNAEFPHAFATAGTYAVTLSVKTDKGCTSTVASRQVIVSPLPQPGFSMPGSCLSDPVSQFMDTSKIADGTAATFSYLWNFGDPNAGAANNISTVKNGQHKFTAVGNYNVSLAVTSAAGCVATTTQTFTVNGAQPVANFSFTGGSEICSNQVLSLVNNSSVDFGSLVKLEIYWDYTGDPTVKTVVPFPTAASTFTHTYQEFFSPDTKANTVRVIAYSGENCLNTSTQLLTLKASPDVYFAAINAVCADAAVFSITTAGISNQLQGSGSFSGTGVSTSGNFNPRNAGAGSHIIRYTYTGTNGCINSRTQTATVYPMPQVDAGPDRFMLEGGNTTLLATASGNNLVFSWTPAIALNSSTILQPVASPSDDILYKLQVASEDGCMAADSVFVKVLKTPTIPNVFTPNGDGVNDRWEIKYIDSYPGAVVKIFNRYGQAVFESVGYSKPWDGTYNGKQVPAGTYYYLIDPKNGRQTISGFVDIVR